MNKRLLVCACLLVVFVVGCGKGFVGLSGRITYSDTGEPLEKGTVALTNDLIMARGVIGADGKYVIGSFTAGDGLPPGTYKVYITDAVQLVGEPPKPGTPGPSKMPEIIPLIDRKYASPDTSGMTLEVTAKTKTFDFQVDRAK